MQLFNVYCAPTTFNSSLSRKSNSKLRRNKNSNDMNNRPVLLSMLSKNRSAAASNRSCQNNKACSHFKRDSAEWMILNICHSQKRSKMSSHLKSSDCKKKTVRLRMNVAKQNANLRDVSESQAHETHKKTLTTNWIRRLKTLSLSRNTFKRRLQMKSNQSQNCQFRSNTTIRKSVTNN